MNGKVARQLRDLCNYARDDIKNAQLLVKRKTKGHKIVLDAAGEHTSPCGTFKYSIVEEERDVCQLHADPVRQAYQDVKNQWKEFTETDHKAAKKSND